MRTKIFKSRIFVYLALVVILLLEFSFTALTYLYLMKHDVGLLRTLPIVLMFFIGIDKLAGMLVRPLIDCFYKQKEGAE